MDRIDATDDWQGPVTLATDEIWQCNSAEVELATGATAVPKGDGARLLGHRLDAIQFSAGTQVQYRSYSGHGVLIRMPV